MGKRELLLIIAFVCAGAIVYQVTVPPAAPGERGFSLSRLIQSVRREIGGRRATAQVTQTFTKPVAGGLREVRIGVRGETSVTGEDRADIQAELKVTSRAYDDAEAQQTAKDTKVKFDDAGDAVTLTIDFPEGGQQTAALNLRVPKRLTVRVDDKSGPFTLSNVAAVEMGSSRGKTDISQVPGRVTVTQRGGALTIKDVGPLRLNVRGGAEVTLAQIAGETTLNLQSGELRGSDLRGAIEVESVSADVRLEKLQASSGPVRVNATAGTIELSGLRSDTRIDGRNSEIRVAIDRPAPVAIYSDGDERVEFTAPAGIGFRLDAIARGGRISADGDLLQRWGLSTDGTGEPEQRATGAVRGGGPTIIIRATRGDIVLRETTR